MRVPPISATGNNKESKREGKEERTKERAQYINIEIKKDRKTERTNDRKKHGMKYLKN